MYLSNLPSPQQLSIDPYWAVKMELDTIDHQLKSIDVSGVESAGDALLGLVKKTSDTFSLFVHQLTKTLTPKTVSTGQTYSPTRRVLESNKSGLLKLYARRMDHFMDLEVPIPTGMAVSYGKTVETLVRAIDDVKALDISTTTAIELAKIYQKISREQPGYEAVTAQLKTTIEGQIKGCTNTVKSSDACFVLNSKTTEGKFSKLFTALDELEKIGNEVVAAERNFIIARDVATNMRETDKVLQDTTNYLMKTPDNVDRVHLALLSGVIRNLAELYRIYGVLTERHTVVDHNFSLVLAQCLSHN